MTSIFITITRARGLALLLIGLVIVCPAEAQQRVEGVLGSASGVAENASFRLTSTVGEPAVGSVLGVAYHHHAGFLSRIRSAPIGTADQEDPAQPNVLALHPPAPNPSRGSAWVQVDLASPAHVRLMVYDALGREVALALDDERPAGRHTVELAPAGLASGTYVIRLVADGEVRVQRLTVVR